MFLVIEKRKIYLILGIAALCIGLFFTFNLLKNSLAQPVSENSDYIKWIDFDVPYPLLKEAARLDIESYADLDQVRIHWIQVLAYLGAKYGGDFSKYKASHLDKLIANLEDGKTIGEITQKMDNYSYYLQAYTAVLGGFLGEYETASAENPELWERQYGLKAFLPIAKGFSYEHYNDFGNSRTYGYTRRHLGHDLMAATGTPVIAVESGVIEALGWNQYGGWRIGIRSFDGVRYYYYAHLRQNRPYAEGLEVGQTVMAGAVIGYVGRTGYSPKENTNGIKNSHLHYGMQIIFDEAQKDGTTQIWIDLFAITKLLSEHKSETVRNPDTKEHTRAQSFREAIPANHFRPSQTGTEE